MLLTTLSDGGLLVIEIIWKTFYTPVMHNLATIFSGIEISIH